MRSKPIPIACTLDHGAAVEQLYEWSALREQATDVRAITGGARLTLPRPLRAAADDLARREQACCAFLDIAVALDGDEVVLEITADDPDALPVIAALAGL